MGPITAARRQVRKDQVETFVDYLKAMLDQEKDNEGAGFHEKQSASGLSEDGGPGGDGCDGRRGVYRYPSRAGDHRKLAAS